MPGRKAPASLLTVQGSAPLFPCSQNIGTVVRLTIQGRSISLVLRRSLNGCVHRECIVLVVRSWPIRALIPKDPPFFHSLRDFSLSHLEHTTRKSLRDHEIPIWCLIRLTKAALTRINLRRLARIPAQECPASSAVSAFGSRHPCCPFTRTGLSGDPRLFLVGLREVLAGNPFRGDYKNHR